MHSSDDLTALVFVILAALVGGLLMTRVRQPAIVGYILAGVALGPSGFAFVTNRDSVELLAELGVLMLLFLVGMELSLRGFKAVWKVALGTTILQITAGLSIMLLGAWVFGWPAPMAIVFGFVVALSSTAVVVKMLEQVNILRQPAGQLTIGILIAQDLAVVPILLTLGLFADKGVDLWDIAKIVGSIGLLVALILYLSRRKRIVLPFSTLVHGSHDLQPLAALAFCFGAAALTGVIGLSPVLGAFLAGLIVGNSTARPVMVRATRPIQAVLLMVFFLTIGLLIDLNFIWDNIGTVVLLLFMVAIVKTVLNIGFLHLLREPWPHAFIAGVLLAQIGEFSLVLSREARAQGLITAEHAQLIVAVAAFSLLLSPLWLATARRLLRILLLSVTSLQGTLDAIKSPRIATTMHLARRAGYAVTFGSARLFRRKAPDTGPDTPDGGDKAAPAEENPKLLTDQRPEDKQEEPAARAPKQGQRPKQTGKPKSGGKPKPASKPKQAAKSEKRTAKAGAAPKRKPAAKPKAKPPAKPRPAPKNA